MNKALTTIQDVKRAVADILGKEWMFVVLETGGWHIKDPASRYGIERLEFKNGSDIELWPRQGGVRMYVHTRTKQNNYVGQMRFNPRYSTVEYVINAIRNDTSIEDFDLLKV